MPEEPHKLEEAKTTLEFVLLSLTQALGLHSLKQAAAFLTQENKFLMQAVQKGLKGSDFKPIMAWYQVSIGHLELLKKLISEDMDSFHNILKVYGSGILSNDEDVCGIAAEFVSGVIQSLGEVKETQ